MFHRIRVAATVTALAGLLVVCLARVWIGEVTDDHVRTAADAPAAPVAIVLGAGLAADGTPKPYLEQRLADALELYRSGRVRAILVSGDHGTVAYDEVAAMTGWLTDRGVPAGKVVSDHAGFDTWDTCVRAHRIFGVRRALVVTQDFHVRRAVFLCREAGIDATGVSSAAPDGGQLRNQVREVPASVKAALDAALRPSPRYLGRYETSLDEALR